MLILVVAGFVVYSNTFNAPFFFDDQNYIVYNDAIKNFDYFTDSSKLNALTAMIEEPSIRDNFTTKTRILGFFTFALNYRLNGLDVTGYHVFNLIVHLINALLVYLLFSMTLKATLFSTEDSVVGNPDRQSHLNIAFFSALIFVCHPVQTEAVTYISQRLASLATLFYLLSLTSYVRFRVSDSRAGGYALYVTSLISAVCAMLTKEISFTLPVIIGLYEFIFFNGNNCKRSVRYLAPFALTLLIIPSIILLRGFGSTAGVSGIDKSIQALAAEPALTTWDYLITQFRVIITYIRLLFIPVNLNFDYDYPVYHSLFRPEVLLSFISLVSLFALGIYLLRASRDKCPEVKIRLKLISFGIFWFFITISIESSILPIFDVIFEHRLYLPSVGFIAAFVTSMALLEARLINARPHVARSIVPSLMIVAAVFSVLTFARNSVWRDEVRIWEDVVGKSPSKVRPRTNLGLAYYRRGHVEEAIKEFKTAIGLQPDYALGHYNLGVIYDNQGRLDDAAQEYKTATTLKPDYYQAYYRLGMIWFKAGRYEEAALNIRAAINIKPEFANAHYNLGIIYDTQRRLDEAAREYAAAIQLAPDFAFAHNNLGMIYMGQGRLDEAIKALRTALDISPEDPNLRKNLETAMKLKRKGTHAGRP